MSSNFKSRLGLISVAVYIISLGFAPMASADHMGTKLGRGILNVATCWMEVPNQIENRIAEDGPGAGGTVGVFEGIGMTVARAVVGVYEIATFPIPLPDDYEPILKDPAYFLNSE